MRLLVIYGLLCIVFQESQAGRTIYPQVQIFNHFPKPVNVSVLFKNDPPECYAAKVDYWQVVGPTRPGIQQTKRGECLVIKVAGMIVGTNRPCFPIYKNPGGTNKHVFEIDPIRGNKGCVIKAGED